MVLQCFAHNGRRAGSGELLGSAGVYCYDLAGKELWKRTDLGTWEHAFGNAASPVLYGDLVLQWCGPNQKGRNFLIADEKQMG